MSYSGSGKVKWFPLTNSSPAPCWQYTIEAPLDCAKRCATHANTIQPGSNRHDALSVALLACKRAKQVTRFSWTAILILHNSFIHSLWLYQCWWWREKKKNSNVCFNGQMETIRAIALLLIWNSLPGHLPEAITLIQLQVGLITGMEIMRAVLYTLAHPLIN